MALRPVFVTLDSCPFVYEQLVDFRYYSGFDLSQYQKSISSLHAAFNQLPDYLGVSTLEVSSKSSEPIGRQMSAFNLHYRLKCGDSYPLECVFQSSKVFEDQVQFVDLLKMTPGEVKKDPRLKEHGAIVGFRLEGEGFPSNPKTYFYDWIYCNAIYQDIRLSESVLQYSAFTDIVFNPQKSLNCQARSAAKYVGLMRAGLLEMALRSKEDFLRISY